MSQLVDGQPQHRRLSFAMTVAELFRTVRVVGEQVVFLEPRPGLLLNLAHVERIEEEEGVRTTDDYRRLAEQGIPLSDVDECPHGYIRGTCSRCASPAERDEWGAVGP